MPDYIREMRESFVKGTNRVINSWASQKQIPLPTVLTYQGGGNPLGGATAATQQLTFTTGYDGSLTTVAFVLDLSAIDGPDILTT